MNLINFAARMWLRWHGVKWSGASPVVARFAFPRFRIHPGSCIRLGSHCRFGERSQLNAYDGGSILFGDFVSLNDGGAITSLNSVTVGDRTRMAAGVLILDSNFHETRPNKPRRDASVVIGRNVWLASRVTVLPGVTIGDHTSVSAGSVVTRDLPDRCIAMGNPAQVVSRFECPDDWYRT